MKDKDPETIINWQLNRHHQIQSLAEGLLGSSLTILIILIALFSALGSPWPEIQVPDSPQGPEFVGIIATETILLFSYFIILLVGTVSIVMYGLSTWKFLELTLSKPIEPQYPYDIEYEEVIERNSEFIKTYQKRLLYAGIRFPMSLGLAIFAVQFYMDTSQYQIIDIFIINCVIVIPSIMTKIMRAIHQSPEKVDEDEMTLAQEIIYEDHSLSRLSDIQFTKPEKVIMGLAIIMATIIVVTFILSYIV